MEHAATTGRPSPGAPPRSEAPPTLRLQGLVNRLVRAGLATPLLGRLAGRRLLTVYVKGRTTGRRYAVPVAYTRLGGDLVIASAYRWIRNLRTGQPVGIRLAGRRRAAEVQVLTEAGPVSEHLAVMARDNHRFAQFNRIGFDQDGRPVGDDLRRAWSAGVRVVILTPR
jgi:hypothetical protein